MSTEQTFYVSLNKRFTEGWRGRGGMLVGTKLFFTFKLWLSLTGNPTALGRTSLCHDSRSFQIAVLCREGNVHFWRRTSVKFEKVTVILLLVFFFMSFLVAVGLSPQNAKASRLAVIPVVFVCVHGPACPKQDCMYSGLRLRQSLTDYTRATLRRPLEVNLKNKRRRKKKRIKHLSG